MTTLEISEKDIQKMRDLIAKVKDKADEGDDIAELIISVLDFATLTHKQLAALQDLVLTQNNVLKMLVKEGGDTITMPEAPKDLPGYG